MRIYLIRHGETHANVLFNTPDRMMIGALESPLTQLNETGRQQALQTRQYFEGVHVDQVISSDLGRTRETSSILFPDHDVQYTSLLRERSLGSDEGKRTELLFLHPEMQQYHVFPETDSLEVCLSKRVPDGENYLMVMDRCRKVLSQFDFSEEKTVALVAHFHTIRCMRYVLLNKKPDKELFNLMIPNAKPALFEYQKGSFVEIQLD